MIIGTAGTAAFARVVRIDLTDPELADETERIRGRLCRYDWQDPVSRNVAGIPAHLYRDRSGAIRVRYEPFFGEALGWDYAYHLVPVVDEGEER